MKWLAAFLAAVLLGILAWFCSGDSALTAAGGKAAAGQVNGVVNTIAENLEIPLEEVRTTLTAEVNRRMGEITGREGAKLFFDAFFAELLMLMRNRMQSTPDQAVKNRLRELIRMLEDLHTQLSPQFR